MTTPTPDLLRDHSRLRDNPDDRYTITVEGVSHARFHATARDIDEARAVATRICTWTDHRGKRALVKDRTPVTKEVDSIFGGKRTVTRANALVWWTQAPSDYRKPLPKAKVA